MALRHLGRGMLGPGRHRPLVKAVERAVIDALGLEEDDRVRILDRGDQQALGVIGVGRDHRLDPRHVGEEGLGRLAVGLAAENAAAIRRADHHRHRPFAGGAVADAAGLGEDLVEAGEDVIGELDLGDGLQAVKPHADRGGDDAALGDRRVEHAGLAIFLLQAGGDPEDAAEIADILAEHDDVRIARHHHVVGAVQRLDHVHDAHLRAPSPRPRRRRAARRGARAARRTRPRTSNRRPHNGRCRACPASRPPSARRGPRRRAPPPAPCAAPRPIRRGRSDAPSAARSDRRAASAAPASCGR